VDKGFDRADEIGRLRGEIEKLQQALALAEERARVLELAAHEDPITGVFNRRGFERELARAIAYRARYGTAIGLVIADFDGFKRVNDSYGHGAGDALLRHVASLLRRHVRASDSVGRLGGDEFAVLLWQVEEAVAQQKAASLQAIVGGSALDYGGQSIHAELSVGVTALASDDSPNTAFARADRALYANKAWRKAPR
jgi:diguanylate cyclase (GGDEF)-like protein